MFQGPDSDWFTASNWNGNSAPNATSSVFISGGQTAIVAAPGAAADSVLLGFGAVGTLRVQTGGSGGSSSVLIDGAGSMVVTGAGASWTAGFLAIDSDADTAHLTVSGGGSFSAESLQLGSVAERNAQVLVTGAGSSLQDTAAGGQWGLMIGSGGSGKLTISDGASATNTIVGVGYSSPGEVTVTGAGSTWTVSGSLSLGYSDTGRGSVTIADGATGSSPETGLSYYSLGTGAFRITGAGSTWSTHQFSLQRGSLTIDDGGTLDLVGTYAGLSNYDTVRIGLGAAGGTINGYVQNYGTLVFDHTGTSRVNQLLANYGGTVTKDGAGTAILVDGFYVTSGAVTVNAGTLQLGEGGSINYATGNVEVANGARLAFNLSNSWLTYDGSVSGGGSLAKSGSGTVELAGSNSYGGGTTISGGVLAVSADSQLGTAPASATPGHLTLDGGTLEATATFTLSASRGIAIGAGGGALQPSTGTLTYGGTIAGNGELTKSGPGTLLLTGVNTYVGATRLYDGTLQLGHDQALGAGTLIFDGGRLEASGAARTVASAISVVFNSEIGGSLGLVFDGSGTLSTGSTLAVTNAGDTTFNGVISGGGRLANSGTGVLTLAGNNTYTGGTTLSGGTTVVAHNAALGPGTLTLSGGWLQGNGTPRTLANAITLSGNARLAGSSDLTFTGALTVSGGNRTLTADNAGTTTLGNIYLSNTTTGRTLTMAGSGDVVVTGTVANRAGAGTNASHLTKTGAGMLTLSGASTYTGNTTISGGTLRFAKRTALYNNATANWTAAKLIVNAGATAAFNVGGTGEFTAANIDTLKGLGTASGGFRNGSFLGLDTTNAAGGLFTYSSAIGNPNGGSNVLGLVKLGAGTLVLSGTNTYTGATRVSAGTLLVNGSLANTAITVASGATLGGSGTIGGPTTITGMLAPGNSPGMLTFASDLTLGAGSTTLVQLGGLTRGSGYDAIDVGGTLTFGGALAVSFIDDFSPIAGTTFNLFDWSTGASGTFSALDLPSLSGGLVWNETALYSRGELTVSASAIPEPSTYAAIMGAAALALAWRHRRSHMVRTHLKSV